MEHNRKAFAWIVHDSGWQGRGDRVSPRQSAGLAASQWQWQFPMQVEGRAFQTCGGKDSQNAQLLGKRSLSGMTQCCRFGKIRGSHTEPTGCEAGEESSVTVGGAWSHLEELGLVS